MQEASKAKLRRQLDPRFANRWLVGKGLDVGAGTDPLLKEDWPSIVDVRVYDHVFGDKDGQYLPEIADEEFDFVHSSHSLEHMKDVRITLSNWLRVLKPGGFVVCTVPEELLYEGGMWPSRFNPDHKHSFSLRSVQIIPSSIKLSTILWKMSVDLEHLTLLTDGWDVAKLGQDQTVDGNVECAIEFVIRKPKLRNQIPW